MDNKKPNYKKELTFKSSSSFLKPSIRSSFDRLSDRSSDRGRTFDRRSSVRRRSSTRERPFDRRRSSTRRPSVRRPYFRRRSSARRSSDRGRTFDRRSSVRRRSSTRERPFDRRRSSARRPSVRRPYFRRWSSDRGRTFDRRRSSVRRQSSTRERPFDRRCSSTRRPSVRRPYFRRRSSVRTSFRRWSCVSSDEESLYSDSEDYESDWDSVSSSDMEDSEHTLSTTIKTNIHMDKDGLGFVLIQNGPYLQISGLVAKGAAARDGKLQGGDILLKIGHANVLGWTLRELRQLLHTVPIGTVLQIQVYRDFIKIPGRWEAALKNIPELKGPAVDTASYTSEENWTSSEDLDNESEGKTEDTDDTEGTEGTEGVEGTEGIEGTEDTEGTEGIDGSTVESYQEDVRVRTLSVGSVLNRRELSVLNVKAVHSLSFDPSIQPKWISKDWHIFERKTYTFTVGSDIGCDIMIHKDFEAESDVDISTLHLSSSSSSPYWTMPKHKAAPSASSSSSVSDAFWLESVSYEFE